MARVTRSLEAVHESRKPLCTAHPVHRKLTKSMFKLPTQLVRDTLPRNESTISLFLSSIATNPVASAAPRLIEGQQSRAICLRTAPTLKTPEQIWLQQLIQEDNYHWRMLWDQRCRRCYPCSTQQQRTARRTRVACSTPG